jgi:hypothetical protein
MPSKDGETTRVRAELARVHRQLASKNEEIAGLREKLVRSHRRLVGKNEEIVRLRAQLARARQLQGLPSERMPVFFVVGHGRSGTTWLMQILDAHPEILCKGEGYLFNRNFRRDDLKDLHPRLKVSSLYNAIANSEYLKLWTERSVWAAHGDAEEHLDNLTRLAVGYFLTRRLSKAGKKIVGDKTPFISSEILREMIPESNGAYPEANTASYNGVEVLGEIARILPEAKVIHIIRDGRDVAVSMMHFMWSRAIDQEGGLYTLEPEELRRRDAYRQDPSAALAKGLFTERRLTTIARGWNGLVSEALECGTTLLGDRYIEVRYEHLLSRPEEEVRRLLAFLGADASEGAVKSCVETTGFERLSKRERGQEDSTSVRFRKGVAGDWRNAFSEEDKRVFKEEAGELLIELGYEEDHDW